MTDRIHKVLESWHQIMTGGASEGLRELLSLTVPFGRPWYIPRSRVATLLFSIWVRRVRFSAPILDTSGRLFRQIRQCWSLSAR